MNPFPFPNARFGLSRLLPLAIAALISLLPLGCAKSDPMALVGAWAGQRDHDKLAFDFSSDGKVFMLAGNDFAAGETDGTYTIHGDHMTLLLKGLPAQDIAFSKPSSSRLLLTFPEDATPIELTLVGPGGMFSHGAPNAATSEESQAVTCVSNLKQLATATMLYCEDYDGWLPDGNKWSDSLEPYTKAEFLFDCPAVAKSGGHGGYAMDSRVSTTALKSHANPQDVVLYFESSTLARNVSDPQSSLLAKPRHNNKMSFAFLDGHASSR